MTTTRSVNSLFHSRRPPGIAALLLALVCTGCEADLPEASPPVEEAARVSGGALGQGGELGVYAGLEGLFIEMLGTADEGIWETAFGSKGTVGAYLVLGASIGSVKATAKVGLVGFEAPDGTISGTYCGNKAGVTLLAGGEGGTFRRSDGATMTIHSIEAGFGISLASECLTVLGLRF
jgi:hypothetical protein